jgi:putative tricarboxylic transport membrane protein
MIEMANSFYAGFSQIFQGTTFGLMMLGILIGFAVGILPGLGGPTTLALMLPFVVKMTPVQAFAFLLGMSAVVNTTGDITSILFGVPGEPTTAATIVDGHPMAKKGEAGRALGAALLSSLIGAIFGAFALALAIPVVRPLVLTFGSPEFFMLAVLGLTFVASLSGPSLLRGLISGGIGLFLATVGLDPMSGIQRYTLGQLFLWDGIGLVPITIGFFAIPEIVDLAVQGSSIAAERVGKLGGVMEGVKDTLHHWWLVIRCSAIGTFTAIIPGMGGATTQWLAYAHAVQSSPNKERFGKGAVEGVLGPGASNNSTLGGSLITTIAFGVPASVTMAILLGAFLIHGVVPGPDMLIPEPKGHLSLTFSFVWINVVSNLITVGACFLFLKQLVKITYRLFLATDNYGLAWLLRPAVLILLAITLFGAFFPMVKRKKKRERDIRVDHGDRLVPHDKGIGWIRRVNGAAIFDFAVMIIFGCALFVSRNFSFRAGLFPWTVGIPVFVLANAQFVADFRLRRGSGAPVDHAVEMESEIPRTVVRRRTAEIFSWIVGFFVGIWLLGFSIGGPLCTFIQLKFGYREKWPITLILTGSTWVFIYGLFDRILHVPFPTGWLFGWF